MDERVERSDTQLKQAPVSRETRPAPRSRGGYWLLTLLIAAGLGGGGWY
jgi:hypothetical protein